MNPENVKIVYWLLSAGCGYVLARRANSFNHWGNALVGVCLLSLAWMAIPGEPTLAARNPRLDQAQSRMFADMESLFVRLTDDKNTIEDQETR